MGTYSHFCCYSFIFWCQAAPELSESLGKSLKRFKKATSEVEDEVRSALDEANKNTQTDSCTIDTDNHSNKND